MGYPIIVYRINVTVYTLRSYSNSTSGNIPVCEWKVHQKEGSKNSGFPQFIYFEFEDKSILSDRAE